MFSEVLKAKQNQLEPSPEPQKADHQTLLKIAEIGPSNFLIGDYTESARLGDEQLTKEEFHFLKEVLHSYRTTGRSTTLTYG